MKKKMNLHQCFVEEEVFFKFLTIKILILKEITSESTSCGVGTKSIENVFQKEAKIIREKMFDSTGKKYGPLVHDIDGFKIEVF